MPTKDDFPKDLPADAVLPFTLSGIALEIPRSTLTPELWLAFEAGYYESSEISALRAAIRPGDAVLEVGAGVGFISAFVKRALGAATVWVIEANEALIPIIRRTHELNGVSATVLTGVAGRRDGPVRFHHQAAFWGSSVLPLPGSQAVNGLGIDLGRVIREMRPDVLVVDIEGGERDLFAGLDLSGVRSVVVEVHHPEIGPGGIAKCFAALQDAGFAYYPDGSAGTNVVFTRFRLSSPNAGVSDLSGKVGLGDHPGIVHAVFDCVIYDGEIDALAIRLHELDPVVDWFIIVESTMTFSGLPRDISFDPSDPRIAHFAPRFRHVVVADMPETDDPWQREIWQRNAVLRGVPDAAPDDLLILSDVDEVPRAAVISEMRNDRETAVFGLELGFYYFFVDYRNVQGPEAAITWTVVARRSALNAISPNDLRYAVRDRHVPARIVGNAGWHFSYLMDEARVRRKIASFSHQEFNNPAFLEQMDINALVQRQGDFFQRSGFVWSLVRTTELPTWLQANKDALDHLFAPGGPAPGRPILEPLPPVVICPYLLDREKDEIREKFSLESEQGAAIPFFLWQDTERIGPEHAFEQCWERFPDRDIIIIHSDMAPFPGDAPTLWYDKLCEYRSLRPDAGMIAANLFYPPAGPDAPLRVQCAGGTFRNDTIHHLHGEVDSVGGVSRSLLDAVRPVDWVTFGGVLIRRELIKACGAFDRRYQWAYYMDCDYCFEARLRGFRLLQVPVRLLHEESRSTRSATALNPELAQHIQQNKELFSKKWESFLPAMPSEEELGKDLVTSRHVARITSLDTQIFSIQAEHNADRVSFLRIQNLVREIRPNYTYLEVGSDIGGSLLPHLLDPHCAAAISIDPRPEALPDERGVPIHYNGNSTERMLVELRRHARPGELSKLSTIDKDVSAVDRSTLTTRPHLILIDAEHTNVAAFSDFMAVLPMIADDALVAFHDANLVGDAIQMIERFLQYAQIPYGSMILPSCVAVFGFGAFVRSMETALRSHAEPAAAYFANARHQRHRSVADAVIGQTEGLPGNSIAELLAATSTANAEIASLRLALDKANAAHATVQAELAAATDTANAQMTRLGEALSEAKAMHANDHALIEALQAAINSYTTSTSWRLTAPVRAAVGLVRGRGVSGSPELSSGPPT